MFHLIDHVLELLKSYYVALVYDQNKAAKLLQDINDLRLQIAIDAEMREIFYDQVDIPANASGFQESVWYSRNDIRYVVRRAIAMLDDATTISVVNQGNKQRILTREPLGWQQIFSAIQGLANGQNTLFDFPQEIEFQENEALGLSTQGQTDAGWVFFHGATLKDTLEDARRNDIQDEINTYLPQPQLIPILFQFPNNTAGTLAVNSANGNQIFSTKYNRSIILTEVSTTASDCRLTLIDEARNQLVCERVEMRGIASQFNNSFTAFYKLPYPHLLRRGDRLRIDVLNGSDITGDTEAANEIKFLTFKGYSV